MWLLATVIIFFCALAPLATLVAAGKSVFGTDLDISAVFGLACTICSILVRNGKDSANLLARLMNRAGSLALLLEKFFADLALKTEKFFAPTSDVICKRGDDPINASLYRNSVPRSIALGLCGVFAIAALVGYFAVVDSTKDTDGVLVLQKAEAIQESNKAKKADRIVIVTKFEDRFALDGLGCDGCGGPEVIPLPPRRPHFYPVPRPRPVIPNDGVN
jgi:hypothetical protein